MSNSSDSKFSVSALVSAHRLVAMAFTLTSLCVSSVARADVAPSATLTTATPSPGATPSPDPKKLPQAVIEREDGKPYLLRFNDGREAQLFVTVLDAPKFKSSFQIADNNCTQRQNMRCSYNFGLRFFSVRLAWTKHPDASKIGTSLERGNVDQNGKGANFSPVQFGTVIESGGVHKAQAPRMNKDMAPNEIECQDFSWLPGGATEAPDHLHVSRWDGEDNTANPETGFNENRTVGGAYGVELTRVASNRLQVDSATSVAGLGETFDLLMFEPTISMTLQQTDGGICQVGVASNLLAELQTMIVKMLSSSNGKPAAYIVGSDELLDHRSVKPDIDRFATELTRPISESYVEYR